MCNNACITFGKRYLQDYEIRNKNILEVGSTNINGSLKGHILSFKPLKYVGIDIISGNDVDIVADISTFQYPEKFDMIICTEVLEHVKDWELAITNMKNLLNPKGVILLTTRTPGFPLHSYPYDYWRFTIQDIVSMFEDMTIDVVERDHDFGIMIKCWKPENFILKELKDFNIFRI